MTDWNPNDTSTLGVEWLPYRNGKVLLDSKAKAAALSLVQSAAQQISYLSLYVDDVNPGTPRPGSTSTGPFFPQPNVYGVEVYDDEDAVVDPATLTTLTARPNEDVTTSTFSSSSGGAPGTFFQDIDDETESEWIGNGFGPGAGSNTSYAGRLNTGGLTLTNRRILAVRMVARVVRAFVDNYTAIMLGLNINSNLYVSEPNLLPMWQFATISYTWTYNPATNRPWTIADVQAFDTGDEWVLYPFSFFGAGNVNCYWAKMEVVTCPETRLAFGGVTGLAATDDEKHKLSGAGTQALITPAAAAWTKDGSGRHLYVVRKLSDDGSLALPTLDAVADVPAPTTGPRLFLPTVDPTYGYVTAMGDVQTPIFSLGQYRSTAAFSVDSQPYSALLEALVHTGQNAEQEFSGAAVTTDYNVVRFLVKRPASDAAGNLTVKIKNRSGGTQAGSTVTITPANVTDDSLAGAEFTPVDDGWYVAMVQLATPATLTSATQYYVEFASGNATADSWSIGLLDSRESADSGTTVVGLGGYNDATDRGTANGSELDRYDLAVSVATPPATPTALAAADASDALGFETPCGTSAIPRTHLTWTASATMEQHVERLGTDGTTWERIRELTATGSTSYSCDDYEGRFGVAEQYRVRQQRSDGSVSAWTSPLSHTKPLTTCPTLFLVSNYAPSANYAIDYAPGKQLTFLEADDVTFHNVYGRSGRLSAQPIEERGTLYALTVLVAADDRGSSGGEGLDAFGPLRAVARARLPYVCLVDHYGARLYATLRVPAGAIAEPGGRYHADCEASTAAVTPFVVVT